MMPETLLLRQINPSFVQDGRVTSQAFRPTPKDEHHLSVDNGDRVQAEASWARFTSNSACSSVGVMAVSQAECAAQSLPVIEDENPHPEHCSIDFFRLRKEGHRTQSQGALATGARARLAVFGMWGSVRYQHYLSYRPSSVPWLDRMPEHWGTAALRWVSRRYAGGTPDKGNDAYWERRYPVDQFRCGE